MSAATTRLNLTKPGGGSTGLIMPPDPVDIDVLNANFDKIDASMGFKVVTSVTRPAGPFDGQPIFETDTKQIRVFRQTGAIWDAPGYGRGGLSDYLVTTPTALDLITDATIGDSAWMTTPGTGIDPMRWRAYAGAGGGIDWQPADTVIAATKANLDTFIAAVAALPDLRFQVGGMAFAQDTLIMYRFTSAAGALHAASIGLVPVKPTSVAGTNVSIGPDGAIILANASTVNVNGCFTSEFDNYLIRVGRMAKAIASGQMVLRKAGVDAVSGAYDTHGVSESAGATAPRATVSLTSWNASWGGASTHWSADYTLEGPFINAQTIGTMVTRDIVPGSTTSFFASAAIFHNVADTYDGFSLTGMTGLTGRIRVFGYNNN